MCGMDYQVFVLFVHCLGLIWIDKLSCLLSRASNLISVKGSRKLACMINLLTQEMATVSFLLLLEGLSNVDMILIFVPISSIVR